MIARRANVAITIALGAVAGGTIIHEQLLGRREIGARTGLSFKEFNVFRHGADLRCGEDAVNAKPRHLRIPRLGVAAANTVGDGLLQGIKRATPQPGIRRQHRKAGATRARDTVTRLAVIGEGHLARKERVVVKLLVLRNFRDRHRRDLRHVLGM